MSTSPAGSHGHSMLDHLIRHLLEIVFAEEEEDDEETNDEEKADNDDADEEEDKVTTMMLIRRRLTRKRRPTRTRPSMRIRCCPGGAEANLDDSDDDVEENFLEGSSSCSGGASEDLKSIKDNIAFFPGLIKTRRASVHQDLHIDNSNLLGNPFFLDEAVLAGKLDSIIPLKWMQAGYVVEMPLPREGAFLRIAGPDPVKKIFEIDWLFIPFGSFVVRSNALFHSGHYGSPGNKQHASPHHCI
jgi:hypothetical protein